MVVDSPHIHSSNIFPDASRLFAPLSTQHKTQDHGALPRGHILSSTLRFLSKVPNIQLMVFSYYKRLVEMFQGMICDDVAIWVISSPLMLHFFLFADIACLIYKCCDEILDYYDRCCTKRTPYFNGIFLQNRFDTIS